MASIDNFDSARCASPALVSSPTRIETDAEPFVRSSTRFFAQFESHQRARTTRQKDGFKWQSQLLANLGFYARRRVPASWAGALQGLPAFICGAAPARRSTSRCTR